MVRLVSPLKLNIDFGHMADQWVQSSPRNKKVAASLCLYEGFNWVRCPLVWFGFSKICLFALLEDF